MYLITQHLTFEIDVYENSALLADFNSTVFLNNELKLKDVDYELGTPSNNFKTIKFLSYPPPPKNRFDNW